MKTVLSLLLATLFLLQEYENALPLNQSDSARNSSDYKQEVQDLIKAFYLFDQNGTLNSPTERADRYVQRILSIAKKSREARRIVVDALIAVFKDKQPPPDAQTEENTVYDAQMYAAHILAKLRAVESLDVLVRNLHHRGSLSSLSLNSRPMVEAVVEMGEAAVPYLEKTLRDERISVRKEAAIALGFIGGKNAKRVLENALSKEKDEGTIAHIKGGLSEIDNQAHRKRKR